ncbi:MAG: HAD-IC family P-type ATPase [Oscillospiraceae bacterium]|nr:HAD-IC family P-type ATPase [Oscillospiraceae bacterium]
MDSIDINTGLTASQAESRAANGRSNSGSDIKTKSSFQIVCENVFTLFNLINLILAVMVISVGSYRNALFMGVVICNTAIGIFQGIRAKRAIDKLSIISAPKARVIRDGNEATIPVGEVVLDDIMILSSGMQICADAVVLEGECETDESLITGESDAIFKKNGDELFSGSFVVSGRVKAQAIRVGAESASGRITGGSKYIKKGDSEMMKSINRIIKLVSICIVPFGAIMLYKSLVVLKQPLEASITAMTAALIGMIPEGLVLLTGIALAVSAIRLSRNNTLCRDLYCVESLARVDVLCLDKTGTLTEGCMEVVKTEPLGSSDGDIDLDTALNAFVSAFPEPNSTLKALAERYSGGTAHTLRNTVPFSSARKWSAAEFDVLGTLVLGAPEFVMGENSAQISEMCAKYSANGMRTLVLARSPLPLPEHPGALPQDLRAVALIVLSDKLRPSAPATLEYFRQQGVDIKVISGDDPTAVSMIAKRAGLENAGSFVDMSRVPDGDIPNAAEKYSVFGRTTPDQKLRLIKALKA